MVVYNMKAWGFIIICMALSVPSQGAIYKCEDNTGLTGFSDRPCPEDQRQAMINLNSTTWIDRLKSRKSTKIVITGIKMLEGEVIIEFEFTTPIASERFILLTHLLSNKNVYIVNHRLQPEKNLGISEIKITDKPYPIADEFSLVHSF